MAQITCTNIELTDGMKDLVLRFRVGKKEDTMTFALPKTKVLERDPETGEPTKTDGPFKNGRLKAAIVLKCIHEVLEHYYGPQSHDAAERVDIWVKTFDTFPGKIRGNCRNFIDKIMEVRDWCDGLLAFNNGWEHSIDAWLLRRTTLRVFNSWASENDCNDNWPDPDKDGEDEEEIETDE